MRYGAVVTLRLLPNWLALSRHERDAKTAAMFEIARRDDGEVDLAWFDADALGSGFTDWVLCRFDSLDRYQALWEELRDLKFFSMPYAEIVQVLLGLDGGHQRFGNGEL